jgi:hypothetical protein
MVRWDMGSAKGFPYKPDDKRLYCNINAPFTAVGE